MSPDLLVFEERTQETQLPSVYSLFNATQWSYGD